MQSSPGGVEVQESGNGELKVSIPLKKRRGTIDTPDGTLYVSKPFMTPNSKKLKALISFTPRVSHFDPANVNSVSNEFRGFFTLFWISLFLAMVQSYVRMYETSGHPIALAFAAMFSRHAFSLAVSDGVLVGSTVFSYFFGVALKRNWIDYYQSGLIIQHTFQMSVLMVTVTWTFNRQWPWVQSGFLTLHALVMIMKCHSYMAVNGYLQWVDRMYNKTKKQLDKAVQAPHIGGWDKAIRDAQASATDSVTVSSTPDDISEVGTPPINPMQKDDGTIRSYIDPTQAQVLRQRIIEATSTDPTAKNHNHVTATAESTEQPERTQHPLIDHPDSLVSTIAQNLSDMEKELTSNGKQAIRWPNNISLLSFGDYMIIPTLVYELEYPRTESIRPLYVLEKTIATMGSFALLYTVTAHLILPLVPTREQSFLRSLLDLSLPFMIAYLLLFFIIFECICNGFAELSRFADRQFYEDWVWNSTTWDEFARKWNRPVHTFLLRHVYTSTMTTYKLSRQSATFVTFLLSAVIHELVMIVVTKKFRFYLFVMQMIQIPLIAIGRIPAVKRNKTLGNIVFWLGLYAGFPLLCVAYCAY